MDIFAKIINSFQEIIKNQNFSDDGIETLSRTHFCVKILQFHFSFFLTIIELS